jgi:hypothetical protein
MTNIDSEQISQMTAEELFQSIPVAPAPNEPTLTEPKPPQSKPELQMAPIPVTRGRERPLTEAQLNEIVAMRGIWSKSALAKAFHIGVPRVEKIWKLSVENIEQGLPSTEGVESRRAPNKSREANVQGGTVEYRVSPNYFVEEPLPPIKQSLKNQVIKRKHKKRYESDSDSELEVDTFGEYDDETEALVIELDEGMNALRAGVDDKEHVKSLRLLNSKLLKKKFFDRIEFSDNRKTINNLTRKGGSISKRLNMEKAAQQVGTFIESSEGMKRLVQVDPLPNVEPPTPKVLTSEEQIALMRQAYSNSHK